MVQFAPVAPESPGRQRATLLASAATGAPVSWQRGIAVEYGQCVGYRIASDCPLPDEAGVDDHGWLDAAGPYAARPYVVQAGLECSTVQARAQLTTDRVRELVTGVTSYAMALELWSGALSAASAYAVPDSFSNPDAGGGLRQNPLLADAAVTVVGGGAVSPRRAAGLLEDAVGDLTRGGRAYLHMSPAVASLLCDFWEVAGNTLVTKTGAVVVADAGYPGTGPAGTGNWMFGTGTVTAWTGDVDVYNAPSQTITREINHMTVWGERPALAVFDPCTLVAAELDLTGA